MSVMSSIYPPVAVWKFFYTNPLSIQRFISIFRHFYVPYIQKKRFSQQFHWDDI